MPSGKDCLHLCSILRGTPFFTMGKISSCNALVRSTTQCQKAHPRPQEPGRLQDGRAARGHPFPLPPVEGNHGHCPGWVGGRWRPIWKRGRLMTSGLPPVPLQSRAQAPYCSLLGTQEGAPCTAPPAQPGAGTRARGDPRTL